MKQSTVFCKFLHSNKPVYCVTLLDHQGLEGWREEFKYLNKLGMVYPASLKLKSFKLNFYIPKALIDWTDRTHDEFKVDESKYVSQQIIREIFQIHMEISCVNTKIKARGKHTEERPP